MNATMIKKSEIDAQLTLHYNIINKFIKSNYKNSEKLILLSHKYDTSNLR